MKSLLILGEAEYVNDINPSHGELFGAFVLSKAAQATLAEIDASEAEVWNIVILWKDFESMIFKDTNQSYGIF